MAAALKHENVGLKRWRFVVPHAQVLTLNTVPIALVPAPDNAKNYYQVVSVGAFANVAAGTYTANGSVTLLEFFYGNTSGPVCANSADFHVAIGANVSFAIVGGPVVNIISTNATSIIGQGIAVALINTGGTDLTGGNANNTLIIEVVTHEFNADPASV
jgi:hypothetical protein